MLNILLHAKYYRADNECLVGSANLTNRALGWSNQSNLEILIPVTASEHNLKAFEKKLLDESIEVDESIYKETLHAVQVFQCTDKIIINCDLEESLLREEDAQELSPFWLPTLRNPGDLFTAYRGNSEQLSSSSRSAAITDLANLRIIPGLSETSFDAYVGAALLQKPIIRHIDKMLVKPQRFGAIRDYLLTIDQISTASAANRAWQTTMRWLRHFLPGRYSLAVPHHSEIFFRIQSE